MKKFNNSKTIQRHVNETQVQHRSKNCLIKLYFSLQCLIRYNNITIVFYIYKRNEESEIDHKASNWFGWYEFGLKQIFKLLFRQNFFSWCWLHWLLIVLYFKLNIKKQSKLSIKVVNLMEMFHSIRGCNLICHKMAFRIPVFFKNKLDQVQGF